ncbi:MAG: YbjN domain-containing protein [Acidobacteria bacterium]|nr:YbjN domain-containing protein [Acidobacteriota bacterium]MBI3422968.1 YbjN domain-containing protein [Acidobacteriota bacterium]
MKKTGSLSLALLLTLVCAVAVPAQTNSQTATATAADKAAQAKVVQLLEASGQAYAKAKEGVWVVKFKGNQLPEISVVTIYSQGMLIFVSTAAEKAEIKTSPELLQKLLTLNDDLDRVKVGLDNKDGDIFVRIDLSLRVVDQQEFNANLDQISAAVDETYAALKPFLLAPKKPVK